MAVVIPGGGEGGCSGEARRRQFRPGTWSECWPAAGTFPFVAMDGWTLRRKRNWWNEEKEKEMGQKMGQRLLGFMHRGKRWDDLRRALHRKVMRRSCLFGTPAEGEDLGWMR